MCVAATLAWGAGAFGAIYAWAYVPLIAGAAALGTAGLIFGRGPVPWSLVVGLSLVGLVVSLQLIPLSVETLGALSPHALEIHRQRDLDAAVGAAGSLPLSIDPGQTRLGLMFLAAFAMLATGTARMLTRYSARQLTACLAVVGVALSIAGLVQYATFNGKIYGFWELAQGGAPFGPFINRNHFAGWMLMVVPLTVGLFASVVSRTMTGVRPDWRNQILWFATPDANKAILVAFAVMTMALAVVATMSRSGISAFAAAMIFASLVMVTRRSTRSHRSRWIVPGYLALVCIVVTSWVGVDRITARFGSSPSVNAEGRRAIWADAWHMVNDFALTGTGLNTFGSAALFYQTSLKGSHMREAHNDYLQIAAEGGVLAGVPVVLSVAALITGIRRRLRDDVGSIWWIRMGAVTGLLAIAAQSFVEFSLQMPGNAALFAVLCGIALHDGGRAASQPLPDALALGLVEPPPPVSAASEKIVRISKGHRSLDFSFDEQSPATRNSHRNFEPALLDEAEDRRLPMAQREARPTPRTPRAAAPGRRLAGVVAVLSLLLFLLMILGILRS
jgi:O-antigen ligase